MIRLIRKPVMRARQFRNRQDGNATIEFVFLFPLFVFLLIASYEMGILQVRHVMLDRALDLSVRALRLGQVKDPTAAKLKIAICQTAGLIPDCMNALHLELQPVSTTTWNPLDKKAQCIDKSAEIQPVTTLIPGAPNELMLVRVCAKVNPLFGISGRPFGIRMPIDGAGQYALVSSTAFVNEP
ncbi:TadE/TadG family type IV pilus assembly protein [Pseudogemmobacter sp. W21_MBD1_M6]|uniref:TadE/TadG family type IV pilus assembly protein n=1 Tax=Pseudogemmobacter sp. W21_MBD1_M6 TaxID=3240271 RepID=UPI003F98FAEC